MITAADFARYDPQQVVLSVQDVSHGTDQFVGLVVTTTNKFIVKRPKEEEAKIHNARWAAHLLKAVEIPMPRILYHDAEILVETFVEGKHLTETTPLEVFAQLGSYVRRLHSIQMQGYGEITSSGLGAHATEVEALHDWMNLDGKLIEECCMLDGIDLRAMHEKNVGLLDSTRSVLLHADIKSDNVLTDGSKVTAIIDFADACAGAPEYDLGWFYIHTERDEVWDSFIQGYNTAFDKRKCLYYATIFGSCLVAFEIFPKGSLRHQKFLRLIQLYQ